MTDCDDVAPGSTTTLMQCGTGYASRFKFAGEAARYDGFTQFKTKEVKLATQSSFSNRSNIHPSERAYSC